MGLPDSADELLARADFYLNGGLDEAEIIIADLAAALRRQRDSVGDDLIRVGMFAYPEEAERSVYVNGDPALFPWPDPRFPDAIPIFVRRSDLPVESGETTDGPV